jgi:hypothetical protein
MGDTLLMRLDQHRNIYAAWPKAPQGAFDLIGFGSQFGSSSAPFLSGYQVFPAFPEDLDTTICPAVSGVSAKSDDPYSFAVSWNPTADSAYFIRYREAAGTSWLDSADLTVANYTATGLKKQTQYFVEIYTYCGCYKESNVYTRTIETQTIGGLTENAAQKMVVYPNPAGSTLHLSSSTTAVVRNIMGQIVLTPGKTNRIDISQLQTGMYLLETAEGEILRFIKK